MADTEQQQRITKQGRLWWLSFEASSFTKDAAGSLSLHAVNGLFVQAQVLLEPIPHTPGGEKEGVCLSERHIHLSS